MATLARAPLYQRSQPKRLVAGWAAQNLLTTTLAVVVAAAPFQNNTVSQVQSKRQYLNGDTSAGMPKALFADPSQPAGAEQISSAPVRLRINADSSSGSSVALLNAVVTSPAIDPQFLAPQTHRRLLSETSQSVPKSLFGDQVTPTFNVYGAQAPARRSIGADTTSDSPLPLLTVIVPSPFTPYLQLVPLRAKWLPADTSQRMPKPLFDDEVIASAMPESQAPLRKPSYLSQSTYRNAAVLDTVVPQPQFIPSLVQALWRPSITTDTTQDTPKTLFGDQAAAFVNPPHSAPERIRTVRDTSQGSAKVLDVVAPPFVNPPHTQPDRVRAVVDASAGTPKTLYADATLPTVNPPYTPPDRVRPVYDTSQDTPKPMFGDQAAAFVNLPYPTPDRVRPVFDTSRGSDPNFIVQSVVVPDVIGQTQANGTATLQAAGFVVNVQTQQSNSDAGIIVDERPVGGTVAPYGSTVTIYVSAGPSQGAGRKRHRERYIARYKGEEYEFSTLEGLEEFVQQAQQAEQKRPKQYRKPVKIRLTPDFQDEVREYVHSTVEIAKLQPSAALEQVRAIERKLRAVVEEDDDDDEVLLWLM